ncbi:MAG: histidinol-phosphatase [Thermodesulfobacteriota bacterium]
MIKSDYHIHTSFCNHAYESIESFIKKAADKGLNEILFLDHLTLFEKDFKNSMTVKEVPLYFYKVKKAAEKFKNLITVKCGLEVDFHPDYFDETEKICSKYDFDMIGASVHFVKGYNIASRSKAKDYSHMKLYELSIEYFDLIDKMLEYNFYDTICHLDIIFKFRKFIDEKTYRYTYSRVEEILNKIASKNISVEINTGGYSHIIKRQYPCREILKKCFKKNISITPGSDAHEPEQVGRDFDKAYKLLKELGINKIASYSRRTKHEVSM